MIQCLHPSQRPILVAASDTLDAALARSAIEELGLIPVLVQDAAETIRQLSGGARRYAALVAGERVGEATGFTLCRVARDAGCRCCCSRARSAAGPRFVRHDSRSACSGSRCPRTGWRRC
jgi:hypothetical protein